MKNALKRSDLKVNRKQSWIVLRKLLFRLRSVSVCILTTRHPIVFLHLMCIPFCIISEKIHIFAVAYYNKNGKGHTI